MASHRLAWSVFLAAVNSASRVGAQTCHDQWTPGPSPAIGYIGALTIVDFGGAPTPFATRLYQPPSSPPLRWVVRWNGSQWEDIGTVNDIVNDFEAFHDGAGPALFIAGSFYDVAGLYTPALARWDGTQWSAVNAGFQPGILGSPTLLTLCKYDDGGGARLIVGGMFGGVGGLTTSAIASWDGTQWSDFGGGMTGGLRIVLTLAVFDDGSGPSLYAGGHFGFAGGVQSPLIARWDGQQWHPLGSGITYAAPCVDGPEVDALRVFDDGSGPALYVGGDFCDAGGVAGTRDLARWDGSSWSGIGATLTSQNSVWALYVFDDVVRGPGLIVGGDFATIGGVNAPYIARYGASGWSGLGPGAPEGAFTHMARFDQGSTPTLWVNSFFEIGPGQWHSVGRYQYVCEPCYPDCDGSGTLTLADFPCFQARFVGAAPEADCNADGVLTVQDFGCFQTKFVAGCP